MRLGECPEVGREEIRRAAAGLDVGGDASTSLTCRYPADQRMRKIAPQPTFEAAQSNAFLP